MRAGRASGPAVAAAVAFLKASRDSGGTELGVALDQALRVGRGEGRTARHVLVITDAEVPDSGRILRLADDEAKRDDPRRASVLCIDAAPNAYLALELAERGGGVARFLTSDLGQEDIATALDEVLADWSEPVLSGLRLEVDRADVRAGGRAVSAGSRPGWGAIDLGDLPTGRPLWVVGRAPHGDDPRGPNFRLTTAQGREPADCRSGPAGESPAGPAIKALFGARQVLGLEQLIHSGLPPDGLHDGLRRLGYDPALVLKDQAGEAPTVYPENVAGASGALRKLLVGEALAHGLACSETAFLAVRTEAGRPVEERVNVANAAPAGWWDDIVMCPPCDISALGVCPSIAFGR